MPSEIKFFMFVGMTYGGIVPDFGRVFTFLWPICKFPKLCDRKFIGSSR